MKIIKRGDRKTIDCKCMADFKFDSDLAEILAKWYLRFNGYFTVDNFIIHAGDDTTRISKGKISSHTETDILAIRYKYSREISGKLYIANDPKIVNPIEAKIDFVIAEVKTGRKAKLNKAWAEKRISVIEYILRFAGFIETDEVLTKIASELATNGVAHSKDESFSVRVILISQKRASKRWQHLTNILFDDIINFLINVRGQSWTNAEIGTASMHDHWDDLIKDIFDILNNPANDVVIQKQNIIELLREK
jgi:hypothetical protein